MAHLPRALTAAALAASLVSAGSVAAHGSCTQKLNASSGYIKCPTGRHRAHLIYHNGVTYAVTHGPWVPAGTASWATAPWAYPAAGISTDHP